MKDSQDNPELTALFRADQADRNPPPPLSEAQELIKRDVARRQRVVELLAQSGAQSSNDYYHAAMIFQHGRELDDYLQAQKLAEKAAALDPSNAKAKWLQAASHDRYLWRQGKAQRYGTQYRKKDGRWELLPVDPAFSDDERAALNCPPLAEALRRVEMMNHSDTPESK